MKTARKRTRLSSVANAMRLLKVFSDRARGYAIEDEEIEAGLRSIATVVRNDTGNVIASIGIAGPAHRLTKKVLLSYARGLIAATDAVSQRLGYQPMQTSLQWAVGSLQ